VGPPIHRRSRELRARPLLHAIVEDIAWVMGIEREQENASNGRLVRRSDGTWVKVETAEYGYEDLPKALCVFREGLFDNPDVRMRIGPIVGKVTQTSVVILVETETACDLVLNLARVSTTGHAKSTSATTAAVGSWALVPTGADAEEAVGWNAAPPLPGRGLQTMRFLAGGSVSICHGVEPRRPYSFVFEGLVPDTPYLVFLSNVCQEDLDRRVARFRTLPRPIESLRIIVCSGHHPPLRAVGAANPWQRMHSLVCKGAQVNLALHVGSCIDVLPAADLAAKHLRNLQSYTKGARKDLERRACDTLRDAYCQAWGRHDALRRVLAEVGSHLPIFSPPVDLTALRTSGLLDASTGDDRQTLLRIALAVYREYQRALWHAGAHDGNPDVRVDARDEGDAPSAKGFGRRRDLQASGDCDCQTIHGMQNLSTVEEWHIHGFGQVCIFMFDTKGAWLSRGGASSTLLSSLQASALASVLRDPVYKILILCSDIPFVLDQHPDYPRSAASTDHAPMTWSAFPGELASLLDSLFQWKHKRYPEREVLLFSSGPGFGTTGDVSDHQLGLSIPTAIVGPTLGRICRPLRWTLQNTIASGRFSYMYRAPVDRWNFCMVDIDLGTPQRAPVVEVHMVDVPPPTGTAWPDETPTWR